MFSYLKFIYKSFKIPIIRCDVIYGKTGSGKTYYGAYQIQKRLFSGRNVATTLTINTKTLFEKYKKTLRYRLFKKPMGQCWKITQLDDFIFLENCLCVIDEGHRWFWSRAWEKLPEYIPAKIYEHRKYNIDILVIVQDVKSIDSILRRMADRAIQVRSFFIFQYIRFYDVTDIDKEKRKNKGFKFLVRSPFVFSFFNSYEKNTDFDEIIFRHRLVDKRILQ